MKSAKPPVTLEDLLRFKRSEQPRPEFWNEFERELRAKQLAAIVEPRRWWTPLIRVGARVGRMQLPVGAAAILAVSLISIRDNGTTLSTLQIPVLEESEVAAPAVVLADSPEEMVEDQASGYQALVHDVQSADQDLDAIAPVMIESRDQSAIAASLERNDEPSPSARYIAANLAAAQEADPGLMDDVFGRSLRHTQVRQPIQDPLAHVSSPGESRRSRLLATALPVNAGANELGVNANERLGRKLTEERLYDTITRVGVKGDRVAIKF